MSQLTRHFNLVTEKTVMNISLKNFSFFSKFFLVSNILQHFNSNKVMLKNNSEFMKHHVLMKLESPVFYVSYSYVLISFFPVYQESNVALLLLTFSLPLRGNRTSSCLLACLFQKLRVHWSFFVPCLHSKICPEQKKCFFANWINLESTPSCIWSCKLLVYFGVINHNINWST